MVEAPKNRLSNLSYARCDSHTNQHLTLHLLEGVANEEKKVGGMMREKPFSRCQAMSCMRQSSEDSAREMGDESPPALHGLRGL